MATKTKESKVFAVEADEAAALLKALQYPEDVCTDPAKATKKLNKLTTLYEASSKVEGKAETKTFKAIYAALEAGKEITIDTGVAADESEDEEEDETPKTKSKKPKATEKKPSKKAKVEDDESEEEDETSDEEEDETNEDDESEETEESEEEPEEEEESEDEESEEEESEEDDGIIAGDSVKHPKFGKCEVLSVDDDTVRLKTKEGKTFKGVALAKLEKVSGKTSKASENGKGPGRGAQKGAKRPGVVAAILELLLGASKKEPITKEAVLKVLKKKFPERVNKDGTTSMKSTVWGFPYWIPTEKKLKVFTDNEGGYWVRKPKTEE